jgi:hypothetical protein
MRRAVGEPRIRTRRWTRQEYDRLIELGILDRVLEVHRSPARQRPGRSAAYTDVRRIPRQEVVTPLAAPSARIVGADLLP